MYWYVLQETWTMHNSDCLFRDKTRINCWEDGHVSLLMEHGRFEVDQAQRRGGRQRIPWWWCKESRTSDRSKLRSSPVSHTIDIVSQALAMTLCSLTSNLLVVSSIDICLPLTSFSWVFHLPHSSGYLVFTLWSSFACQPSPWSCGPPPSIELLEKQFWGLKELLYFAYNEPLGARCSVWVHFSAGNFGSLLWYCCLGYSASWCSIYHILHLEWCWNMFQAFIWKPRACISLGESLPPSHVFPCTEMLSDLS